VTLFLHENLSGDLIHCILSEFYDVADKHKAKAVPASYCMYIELFAHKLCNTAKGNDLWYCIDPTSHFDQFLAEEEP
jgi:hypothetical protein